MVLNTAIAQQVRVNADREPLDKVLEGLGVDLSFDSRALSAYKVTLNRSFPSPKAAILFLLADKPYICEEIGGVYVISRLKEKPAQPKPASKKSASKTVTYLERPPEIKVVDVGEITITAPRRQLIFGGTSREAGELTGSQQSARALPGSSDNIVFNLLRMMPGVRASGEPSDELMVWGSNAGESRIVFDGIPLYGMRGFNDNISFINPYLVRSIRLMKGGYGTEYGNQTGAVAEIQGNEADYSKPSFKAMVSTLTANVYGSVPVTKRSALAVAYRRTFYDLYHSSLLNPYNGKSTAAKAQGQGKGLDKIAEKASSQTTDEMYVTPSYTFSDLNVSYTGEAFENDTYRIALYGADDKFGFTAQPVDAELMEGKQHCHQIGASGLYDRYWRNASHTRLSFAFSRMKKEDEETGLYVVSRSVRQLSARLVHDFPVGTRQRISAGAEFNRYEAAGEGLSDWSTFLSDRLTLGRLWMNAGLRADWLSDAVKVQPRLSAGYDLGKGFALSAAWGLYNQYLSRIPYEVSDKNYLSNWAIHSQLRSMHGVANFSYQSVHGFTASVEGYLKNTRNAVRLVDFQPTPVSVDVRGVDVFAKQEFKAGAVFGSYSLTSVKEAYSETGHEIKLGGLLKLKSFLLSANYVYGTGFSIPDYSGNNSNGKGKGAGIKQTEKETSYSRLDASATYRLIFRTCQLHVGASVINVFGADNLKYSYTLQAKDEPVTFYSKAMPFTPMFFLEFMW